MATGRNPLLHLAAAILCLAPGTAARAAEPVCAAASAGGAACIAGRLCSCGFARASQATGLPDGFRWDCGILRPACGQPTPATVDPWQGTLPDALAVDRSRTIIRQGTAEPGRWPRH